MMRYVYKRIVRNITLKAKNANVGFTAVCFLKLPRVKIVFIAENSDEEN